MTNDYILGPYCVNKQKGVWLGGLFSSS